MMKVETNRGWITKSVAESSSETEEEEQDASWDLLVEAAFEQCQPEFEERVEKYMQRDDGVDQLQAREHVFEQMKDIYRKAMVNSFVKKMLWFNALRKEPVYATIKNTVSALKMDDDYDDEEAWKSATSKRKYLFDRILDWYEAPELEEDERVDTGDSQEGGGGGDTAGLSVDKKNEITMASPAQQVVEMARSELDRIKRKRAASPVTMDRDTKFHIIG